MALICSIDINGAKNYLETRTNAYKTEVYHRLTGVTCTEEQAAEYFAFATPWDTAFSYLADSVTQILKGKFSDKVTLLGTIGEIGLAFTGVDVVQDIRDLGHDFIHWEFNLEHIGETLLDGVSLLPVVGILGKSDEMLLVLKRSDGVFEIRKAKNLDNLIDGLDGTKYIAKNADLLGTAKATLKSVEAKLYSNILNSCETVPAYRAAYATAGEYSNPVVENLLKYEDDLTYIKSKSPDLAKEAITEVAQESGKSSDEIGEIAQEAIEEAKKKADEVVGELSGEWVQVNESMSDFSRAYQKQITGQEGMAWVQNGVKFDGMKEGVLLDAKAKYAQFIDGDTGEFYSWFSGKQDLVDEARLQIGASEGAKIKWYFAEEDTLNVVQDLFMDEGITGIELIFEAPKF